MESLTQLYLDRSKVTQLHPSIRNLIGLTLLDLSYCFSLCSLPCEIGNLRSLKTLRLKHCTKLDQIPPSLGNVESLETLEIIKTSISHAPSSIHCLKNLKTLECAGLSCNIWKSLVPQFNIHPISSGLRCLKTLNLSCSKLVDEDVPEDLHCFSSLEILFLNCNYFVKLSDSLSHLKKLKRLYLNRCTNLKDLPKLPASLRYVKGEECKSMSKIFYNKILHIPSSFGYCVLDFSLDSQTRKVEYVGNDVVCNLKSSMLSRRNTELSISDEMARFFIHSRLDIFKCCDQIKEGNWINIQYNLESWSKTDISNVCGVFLVANVEYQETFDRFKVVHGKFSVNFEIEGNPSNFCQVMCAKLAFPHPRSIWEAYIPINILKDGLMAQNSCSIKATISCDNIYAKIKACGSSILSWKDASKYLANFFTYFHCSDRKFRRIIKEPNHKSECRCYELEVAKDDFSSSTFESSGTDSTFLLRKNLRSILGRLFEEEKDYFGKYFFPQTKFFGWFRNQNKKNIVAVKLPLNIHKDKKWMGLAIFAIFSISDNANCFCFNYEIQSSKRTLFNHNCSIPMKLVKYSNQVQFIVFIPRNLYPYQLNSSSKHVYISLNTNVERMQVELCGARLVYKQNVEGLIQTVVDCIVESGDDLYEYYSQENVENLLFMIKSHNHQDSSLHDAFADKPTSVLTNTDSSFTIEQLLHGSFPHPLLQMSVEERFGRKFDLILHGDMIPELFTNQSLGNTARMKLPQDSKLPKGVSLVVCGLVFVDKQTKKLNDLQERERYTKVVDLICKFRVDSYEMDHIHYHFVPQEKLLSQYGSQFIWLFHFPLAEFFIPWHNCNHFGMTLETSCDEIFRVQHCGLHLIHKGERKEIDKMILASTVPPSISHKEKGP